MKNHITETEFRRFVSVFTQAEAGTAVKFTEQLVGADVFAVSVVLEADMVRARAKLPWRVRLALSRLRKDLTVLPLYERATKSQLTQAKLRTLKDVLRPLAQGRHLQEFFLNLDLIAKAIDELPDDIEQDLMNALPVDTVIPLGRVLMETETRLLEGNTRDDGRSPLLQQTIRRQLTAIGGRLCHDSMAADPELVRTLYSRGHIEFDELPDELRLEMKADQLLSWYEKDPHGFLEAFGTFRDARSYARFLYEVLRAFPQIIDGRAFGLASLIVDTIYEHRKERDRLQARSDIVATCCNDLKAPHTEALVNYMVDSDVDKRRHLRRLFLAVGRGAIPAIIEVIARARDPEVCEDAALALTGMGHAGTAKIRTAIVEGEPRPNTLVYLFRVLEKLRDRAAVRVIQRYLRHPAAEVREAAIVALAGILDYEAAHWLQAALSDPDPVVARQALRLLISVSEPDAVLASSLLGLVPTCGPRPNHTKAREVAALEALETLPKCGNPAVGPNQSLEDALLSRLGDRDAAKPFGLLRRRRAMSDDALRAAICDALAIIGGDNSEHRFERYRFEPSPTVAERMKIGLAALKTRHRGAA